MSHINPESSEELPLSFDVGSSSVPSRIEPSSEPIAGDSTRVPKVVTYPGVFTAKPQLLDPNPEPVQIGTTKYYLGCDKDLKLAVEESLSYEHARMALTICLLIGMRGELREISGKNGIYSIAASTTWRELARLFQYTSAPGKDSINKFERWIRDLRAFPFAVQHADSKVMTSFFVENYWVVKTKASSPEDGTVVIQVSEEFHNFLCDMSLSHDIRIDEFLGINGRIAGLLYLWLPARTWHAAKRKQIYEIDAVEALRKIRVEPPKTPTGRIFPSAVRKIFEQHEEKSILNQLKGRATRTGYWKRVWLSNSDDPRSCGVKLCIEEIRTTESEDPPLLGARVSSASRGILRSYFLSGKAGRTDKDYFERRNALRTYIHKTGDEFSDREKELLEFLEIQGESFRKNKACLLEIKALLGLEGLDRVLADVASQVREGRSATGSNLQWVIDTAKCYLDPTRHEKEHRSRLGSNSKL